MAIDGPLKLNVQLLRGRDPAVSLGKALVLEAIAHSGSIAAAGRELGISYRRIWLLVDALNRDWKEHVVETQAGGGKGTTLAVFGQRLLERFRAVETAMMQAAQGPDLEWMIGSIHGPV